MNPPKVKEVTTPSNHKTNKTPIIVQSMLRLLTDIRDIRLLPDPADVSPSFPFYSIGNSQVSSLLLTEEVNIAHLNQYETSALPSGRARGSPSRRESRSEPVLPMISQENLAEMVGTTRSRVSHFMNKFRKLGFIEYGDGGGLTVNSSLVSVVLHDWRNPLRISSETTAEKPGNSGNNGPPIRAESCVASTFWSCPVINFDHSRERY